MRRHAAYWIATSAVMMTAIMPPLWSQTAPNCNFDGAPPLTISVAVNPSPSVYGQNVTVSVTTSGVVGCPAIGSVQLTVDNQGFGPAIPLDANGNVTISIPDPANNIPGPLTVFPSIGSHTVGVAYGGGQGQFNYQAQAASSNQITTTVNQAKTTTSLSALGNVTLTATVSVVAPGSGSPTGTVQFGNAGTNIGSAAVSSLTGQATLSVPGLVGLITASYPGDPNFIGSTSAPLRVGPPPTSTLTLTSSLNPSTIAQSVTFTASLLVTNGSGPPTGTVQFSDGSALLGSPVPLTGGPGIFTANFTMSSLTVGSHAINATYGGDSQFPAAADNRGQVVNPVPTVLTLTASPSAPLTGQTVTLTAQLGPQPPTGIPGPTGKVTFSEGTTQLGIAAVDSAAAVFQLGTLTAGTHVIIAVYGGDANWSTVRNTITVTVQSGQLTVGRSLPDAVVGSPYNQTLGATGGTPPYQFPTVSGLPKELTANSAGAITGTPKAAGLITLNVTVVDNTGATASGTVTLNVVIGPLTILTLSPLPDGTAGSDYHAPPMSASGGLPPLQWSLIQSDPAGLGVVLASDGTFSGKPAKSGDFNLTIQVADAPGTKVSKPFTLHVAAAALSITTLTLPGGSAGSPYSASVVATGGTGPYTYSGTLPSNLSIGPSNGAISGTPTVLGPATFTVTVKDSLGATASRTYTVVFTLPAGLTFGGVGDTANPATQPALQLNLNTSFPVTITGTLNLTFQADKGGDNPEVQFLTGGRSMPFTNPANSNSIPNLQLQTGTVAGLITIAANLKVGSTDVTPTPAPTKQIRVNAAAPAIVSVVATRTATGFTVVVTGFSTTLDVSQANFQFSGAPGANLQTSSLTIPVGTLFSNYYQSNTPGLTGSQFVYTQTFTVSGNTQGVTSVSVTLVNSSGTSPAGTATIQ